MFASARVRASRCQGRGRTSSDELNTCITNPIPIDDADFHLSLYGTGFRFGTNVRAFLDDHEVQVTGVAAQPEYDGLDQANIRITADLKGLGDSRLTLSVDGKSSNSVLIGLGPIPPRVHGIAPVSVSLSSTIQVSARGERLAEVAEAIFEPATGLTVSNLQATFTEVKFTLQVTSAAPLGIRSLRLSGPNGLSEPIAFEITEKPLGPTITNFRIGGFALIISGGSVINVVGVLFDFTDDNGDIINPSGRYSGSPAANAANLEVLIRDGGRTCFAFNGTAPFLHKPGALSGSVDDLIPILNQATAPFSRGTQAEVTLIDAAGRRSNTAIVQDPLIGCRP